VSKAQISGGEWFGLRRDSVPTGTLDVTTSGQGVEEAKRYKTIERMDRHVNIPADDAYRHHVRANNPAVAHLRKDGKSSGSTAEEQSRNRDSLSRSPHVVG